MLRDSRKEKSVDRCKGKKKKVRQGKPHRADDRDLVRMGIRELACFDDVRRRIAEIVEGILIKMVQQNSDGACGHKEKSQEVPSFPRIKILIRCS